MLCHVLISPIDLLALVACCCRITEEELGPLKAQLSELDARIKEQVWHNYITFLIKH